MLLTVDLGIAREVEAAMLRATADLTPLAILDGAGSLREAGSGACSASVLRCLKAGSGTVVVSKRVCLWGVWRGVEYSQRACALR